MNPKLLGYAAMALGIGCGVLLWHLSNQLPNAQSGTFGWHSGFKILAIFVGVGGLSLGMTLLNDQFTDPKTGNLVSFHCPNCQRKVTALEVFRFHGKMMRCPQCGHEFRLDKEWTI